MKVPDGCELVPIGYEPVAGEPAKPPQELTPKEIASGRGYTLKTDKERWGVMRNYLVFTDKCQFCEDDWASAWYMGNWDAGRWLCVHCGVNGAWHYNGETDWSAKCATVPTSITAWREFSGRWTQDGINLLNQITKARRAAQKERMGMN